MPLTDQVRIGSSTLATHREQLRSAIAQDELNDSAREAASMLLDLLDSAKDVPLAGESRLDRGLGLDLIELIHAEEDDLVGAKGQREHAVEALRLRVRLGQAIAAAPLVGWLRTRRELDAEEVRGVLSEMDRAAGRLAQSATAEGLETTGQVIADFERTVEEAGPSTSVSVRVKDADLSELMRRLRRSL